MAALLHIDVLRQHTLLSAVFSDLDPALSTEPVAFRPRPVASWRVGPNGRPECRWTVIGVTARPIERHRRGVPRQESVRAPGITA